jgi:hypothetical protein
MSTHKTIILLALFSLIFFSCSSEEKRRAKVSVRLYGNYLNYVSSKNNADLVLNWDDIEIQLDRTKLNAEHSIEKLGSAPELKKNLESITHKYQSLISKIEVVKNKGNSSSTESETKRIRISL